jgi:hypothetical protein
MLHPQDFQAHLEKISRPNLPIADFLKRNIFMYGMWLLGIPAFIYGAADRGIAAFSGETTQVTSLSHCMIALVALLMWFALGMAVNNPEPHRADEAIAWPAIADLDMPSPCIAEQRYRLPFSHRCQIYHLLNLKHLEEIHRFSLGNLKVADVSHFKKTENGGRMRFKTVLDSPNNVLRMWRDPSVEVDLILHTPYQIELRVPAYNQKTIHVLFSVLPLRENEHILSVQMFSDLQWPKELLRAILIIAASLTLLEDLPYLSQLSGGKISRKHPPAEEAIASPAMQLFRRYVSLYGNHWEQVRSLPAA